MQVLRDLIEFIKTLTFVDYVFFGAVLALMLLIITLIYFIRENLNDVPEEKKKEDNLNNILNDGDDEGELYTLEELDNIKKIINNIENNDNKNDNLTRYEKEQEEKAIISYDELIKHKNDFELNYSDEEKLDNTITIKKVDMDNIANKNAIAKSDFKVSVISFEKEESFLKALRELQQKLN